MTQIDLYVKGTAAEAKVNGILTGGMVGARVVIHYDRMWDGMIKTLVCRSSIGDKRYDMVRTITNAGTEETVAHEVMIAGRVLYLGIEGRSMDGSKVYPTVWANCGKIQPGANGGADPTVPATPEVWEQLLIQIGSLEDLHTGAKGNLVEAINEAMTKGNGLPGKDGQGITSVTGNEDGSWTFLFEDGRTETVSNEAYIALKEIVNQLSVGIADKEQLAPGFANSTAECADTSKLYVLPDGFIYAYMGHVGLAYENQIPLSINSDGSAYNGVKGYKTGYRLNSSGVETEQANCGVTGFIPVKYGDVVRFKNFAFTPGGSGSGAYIAIYDSAFTKLSVVNPSGFEDNGYLFRPYTVDEETGYLVSITLANEYDSSYGYAYIRISAPDLDGNTIVTVNEEIPGEEAITYAWGNTGHAFVPADYEDRIISVENDTKLNSAQIASLKFRVAELEGSGSNDSSGIPDYVVTEAESVIDRVIAAQGNRTFTFAALTDMHYGSGSYTAGVINACNAMKYIDERIKLDAVAVLGDYTDGYPDSGYDNAIADFKAVNGVLDGLRFAPNLRLAGNHDIYGENPALTMRYINAYSDDVVWGSSAGGYYYRDFDGYKIRAIGLNTSMLTIEQYNWFVSALDLSGKDDAADWSILVLSHHPLDWYASEEDPVYRFCYILDGYKNGTSGTAGEVSYDFTGGKNAAKLIGNIHGHIHNFKVDYIHFGNVNGNNKSTVLRVATPNACYNRENEYEGTWADETAYNKTKDSAKDTSFCIYCIDLDACTIKAICYGAGYDREIEYGYTNDIEPPAKKTTSSEVWTFELEDGSTVSKQVVVMV